MNKNDFRVQFPLWNSAFWFILMICSYTVVYMVDMKQLNFQGMFGDNGEIFYNKLALLTFIIGLIFLVVFFIVYALKIVQHNKTYPKLKLQPFTITRLIEFIEDDEMLQQVTNIATRKVYVFYSNILPLVVVLMIFPLNRYVYIVAIFSLLIAQNLIYYRHIVKYAVETNGPTVGLMNKKVLLTSAFTILIVVAAAFYVFYQLEKDQEADMQLIEDCLSDGGTIYFERKLLNSVSCGKE